MNRSIRAVLAVAAVSAVSVPAWADKNWKTSVASGNWNTPGNWIEGAVPNSADHVWIYYNDPDPHTITYDGAHSSNLALNMRNLGAGIATLSILSGQSLHTGWASVGIDGRAAIVQNSPNSIVTFDSFLSLGGNATGVGKYSLSSGTLNVGGGGGLNGIFVGDGNVGTFSQSGGRVNTSVTLFVGTNLGSNGTYSLSNVGVINANDNVNVGYSGTGRFTQTGGTHIVGTAANRKDLSLGYNDTGLGTYALSGGSLQVEGDLRVGRDGVGTFAQTGGSLHVGTFLHVGGYQTPGRSMYSISNPGSSVAAPIMQADESGSIQITNGASVVVDRLAAHMTGTISISGATSSLICSELLATAQLFTQAGGAVSAATVYVGRSGSPNETYALQGGTLSAGSMLVGPFDLTGGALVVQTDGVASIFGGLSLGAGSLNSGRYELSGGGVLICGSISVGELGRGAFLQSGGVSTVANSLVVASTVGSAGTYNLSGGTLSSFGAGVGSSGDGTFTLSDSGRQFVNYLNVGGNAGGRGLYTQSGGSLTVSNQYYVGLSGAGTYSKSGGTAMFGDLFLGYYAGGVGTLTQSAGILLASQAYVGGNNVGAAHGSGTLNIDGGTASIAGTLTVYQKGVTRYSGGKLTASAIQLSDGGKVLLTTGGDKLLRATSSLSIDTAGGSLVDLNDNDMIVGSGTGNATVVNYVKLARNGGTWNLPGITSTAAQLNSSTGLGVLSGAEYTSVGGTGTFLGQAYFPTDTLVKFTWNGDANFSGTVNFDDYVRTDVGFNTGLSGWANGDFNYSGSVNFDDYVLLDVAFNTQSGTLGRAVDYLSGDDRSSSGLDDPAVQAVVEHFGQFGLPYAGAFLASVPEPTATGSIVLAISAVCAKRKRR